MTSLVSVYSTKEERVVFEFLREFASKVIYPRRSTKTETCLKYEKNNIFGIVEVVVDDDKTGAIFELALPPHYINYLNWLLEKERNLAPHID